MTHVNRCRGVLGSGALCALAQRRDDWGIIHCVPVIYTPDNEPYLGRASVKLFDNSIVVLMRQQERIYPQTRRSGLTLIQETACEIVPAAISIALSIREMVRQGYLLSALILMRPLMERTATIWYLLKEESAIPLWKQGWPYNSRPNLNGRICALFGADAKDSSDPGVLAIRELVRDYNGLVHGDPAAALHGAILMPDGSPGFTLSKDIRSPARADHICEQSFLMAIALIAACLNIFPSDDRTKSSEEATALAALAAEYGANQAASNASFKRHQ